MFRPVPLARRVPASCPTIFGKSFTKSVSDKVLGMIVVSCSISKTTIAFCLPLVQLSAKPASPFHTLFFFLDATAKALL